MVTSHVDGLAADQRVVPDYCRASISNVALTTGSDMLVNGKPLGKVLFVVVGYCLEPLTIACGEILYRRNTPQK